MKSPAVWEQEPITEIPRGVVYTLHRICIYIVYPQFTIFRFSIKYFFESDLYRL
jgi:hypothetical protein